jgi:hypothetical protein
MSPHHDLENATFDHDPGMPGSVIERPQMKSRIAKRQTRMSGFAGLLAHWCELFDSSIPYLRTLFLAAGLTAAALRTGVLADLLFVTGLVLQFSIWFQDWWEHPRSR